MKINIVSDYPLWFSIFCLGLGVLYAFILYRNEKQFVDASKIIKRIMFAARFLAVSIIAFLLLSPLIKSLSKTVEPPLIIFAQDNSQSIKIGKDSSYYNNEYPKQVSNLIEKLKDQYQIATYSFGEKFNDKIVTNFNDKQTDFDQFLDEIQNRFSNRNVGAMIIASDGIYNRGENPYYSSEKLGFPIYTIALGDTNINKDVILSKVNYNRVTYLGNSFPLEIIVDAHKCQGANSDLTITKESEVVFSKNINFTNNSYTQTINVLLDAKKSGIQHYRISLSPVNGEISTSNNFQDIFINVVDGKEKILILSNSPHPDVSALKLALENNNNYEVESAIATDFNKSLASYNMIILHQLPSEDNSAQQIISEIKRLNIPTLFIIGMQTDLNAFNNIKAGLSISTTKQNPNEAGSILNNEFALFTLSEETKRFTDYFPPLISPFGNYRTTPSANFLYFQKIGSVATRQPLIMFNQNNDFKCGIIAGEGIWKWKLINFAQNNNFNIFNEIVSKIAQFLSVKVDKSFFRVIHKNNFFENESVKFDAEVYNETYELINDPEVNLAITNSENKSFNYSFSKTSNAYTLEAGNLPVGDYHFVSQVKVGEKIYKKSGSFSVSALNLESINTVADHQLLYNISKKHNAEMIFPKEMEKLLDLLKKRDDIKSVSYSQKVLNEMISLYWVFFLILILLSTEWFLRKRFGGY